MLLTKPTPGPRLKSAMIADDATSSRELLRYILTFEGFIVFEASNGRQVMEQVVAIQPDLFVLDLNMPHCDGFMTARLLRAIPKFVDTPIIALSAIAPSEIPQIAEAGFTISLQKPVSPKQFRDLLDGLFSMG